MTKATIENISRRVKWLNSIVEGEITDQNLKRHLVNMRDFCRFSIDGNFASISLNSLKANCKNNCLKDTRIAEWEDFKLLTKAAHDFLEKSAGSSRQLSEIQKESIEDKLKIYQLHANICYLAFVDLLQEISTLQKNSELANTKDTYILERIITKGRAELNHLRSSSLYQKPPLNLVK